MLLDGVGTSQPGLAAASTNKNCKMIYLSELGTTLCQYSAHHWLEAYVQESIKIGWKLKFNKTEWNNGKYDYDDDCVKILMIQID